METETYTKTVERKYTSLGGTEVRTAVLLDFIEEVEDTEPMFPLRWCHKFDKAAEPLVEAGLVGRTNPGSWYCDDREALLSLRDELREEYYDE